MSIEQDIRELADNISKLKEELDDAKHTLTNSQKWEMSVWIFTIMVTTASIMSILLGFVFNTVAEATARETAENIAIHRISDRLRENPSFIRDVQKGIRVVPRGAIVAFDIREGCPEEWSTFETAAGRVIVGVGDGTDLTRREYGDEGGEESVVLNIDQMPSHRHELPGFQRTSEVANVEEFGGFAPGHAFAGDHDKDSNVWVGGPAKDSKQVTDVRGSGMSHENMPPFIALHICKNELS